MRLTLPFRFFQISLTSTHVLNESAIQQLADLRTLDSAKILSNSSGMSFWKNRPCNRQQESQHDFNGPNQLSPTVTPWPRFPWLNQSPHLLRHGPTPRCRVHGLKHQQPSVLYLWENPGTKKHSFLKSMCLSHLWWHYPKNSTLNFSEYTVTLHFHSTNVLKFVASLCTHRKYLSIIEPVLYGRISV